MFSKPSEKNEIILVKTEEIPVKIEEILEIKPDQIIKKTIDLTHIKNIYDSSFSKLDNIVFRSTLEKVQHKIKMFLEGRHLAHLLDNVSSQDEKHENTCFIESLSELERYMTLSILGKPFVDNSEYASILDDCNTTFNDWLGYYAVEVNEEEEESALSIEKLELDYRIKKEEWKEEHLIIDVNVANPKLKLTKKPLNLEQKEPTQLVKEIFGFFELNQNDIEGMVNLLRGDIPNGTETNWINKDLCLNESNTFLFNILMNICLNPANEIRFFALLLAKLNDDNDNDKAQKIFYRNSIHFLRYYLSKRSLIFRMNLGEFERIIEHNNQNAQEINNNDIIKSSRYKFLYDKTVIECVLELFKKKEIYEENSNREVLMVILYKLIDQFEFYEDRSDPIKSIMSLSPNIIKILFDSFKVAKIFDENHSLCNKIIENVLAQPAMFINSIHYLIELLVNEVKLNTSLLEPYLRILKNILSKNNSKHQNYSLIIKVTSLPFADELRHICAIFKLLTESFGLYAHQKKDAVNELLLYNSGDYETIMRKLEELANNTLKQGVILDLIMMAIEFLLALSDVFDVIELVLKNNESIKNLLKIILYYQSLNKMFEEYQQKNEINVEITLKTLTLGRMMSFEASDIVIPSLKRSISNMRKTKQDIDMDRIFAHMCAKSSKMISKLMDLKIIENIEIKLLIRKCPWLIDFKLKMESLK